MRPPPTPAARLAAALAVYLAAGIAGPLSAQDPDTVPRDTVPGDTVPADTLPPDTVPADTVPADTAAADTLPGDVDPQQMQQDLAGGTFPERDSIFRRLMESSGYRIVEYRGQDVELLVDERRILLRDSAQANYSDAALRADSITYRAPLQFMSARGHVRLVSPDRREMATDSVLYYDVSRLKGTVLGARTQFAARGADWYVMGDAVPVGQRTLYVNRGQFTSCDLEDPHYYFKAGQIKMVSRDIIAAWPVTLYISDVPVFWLPFFAQDIRPDRRSGLVPPQFGFNAIVQTSEDVRRNISGFGYYWAINEFMDAKITGDWFSGNYTAVNTTFRYNFLKDFMDGNVQVRHEWGETGRNLRLDASHQQQLGPETRFDAEIEYVQSEQLLRDRSFDTEELTQDINSDVSFSHQLPFADFSFNARRQQSIGSGGGVDLTLPDVRFSFSPVTLFEAPRNRAGFFNNITWSGRTNFTRQEETNERGEDRLSTNASAGQSFSLGNLGLSSSGSFQETQVTPAAVVVDSSGETPDSTFVDLPSNSRSTINWNASSDYQVDLVGSTTLRPDLQLSKAWFRSSVPGDSVRDTGGSFLAAPMRVTGGASLSTDVYGLFPGFGPFSSIRHKISPRFDWNYSPAVTLSDPTVGEIPGFPGGRGRAENSLTVSLNQTFEAKMPVETDTGDGEAEDDGEAGDGPAAAEEEDGPGAAEPDTAGVVRPTGEGAVPDRAAGAPAEADEPGAPAADGDGEDEPDAAAPPPAERRERTVTLLSIRSSSLRFDFNEPGPALVTDRFTNDISSDLFQRLRFSVTHDLFEGSGDDRRFRPFLAEINASFDLASGTGLEDLFGFDAGGGGGGGVARGDGQGEAGRWNVGFNYSLSRRREGGAGAPPGADSHTLNWNLRLQPTPNWRMQWSTLYSFTENGFQSHSVSLERQLHRWLARFEFRKAPGGNFVFQFLVQLRDAPELKVNYDQRSGTSLLP